LHWWSNICNCRRRYNWQQWGAGKV
jgi:hypothetical protein